MPNQTIPNTRFTVGDWEQTVNLPNNTQIHFEPAHHWSARGTRDQRKALWCAFTIETPTRKIYHIGDTGFHSGINFKAAAEKHKRFDLAILPIGDNFTMGIDDAILASDFLECDKILGYHFDTFGYIEIDHEDAKRKFFDKNKDLMLLEIGASIEL